MHSAANCATHSEVQSSGASEQTGGKVGPYLGAIDDPTAIGVHAVKRRADARLAATPLLSSARACRLFLLDRGTGSLFLRRRRSLPLFALGLLLFRGRSCFLRSLRVLLRPHSRRLCFSLLPSAFLLLLHLRCFARRFSFLCSQSRGLFLLCHSRGLSFLLGLDPRRFLFRGDSRHLRLASLPLLRLLLLGLGRRDCGRLLLLGLHSRRLGFDSHLPLPFPLLLLFRFGRFRFRFLPLSLLVFGR